MAKGMVPSYRGYKTYLSVIAAPGDETRCAPILQRMRKNGYRLFAKRERRKKNARARIDGASAAVVFVSKNACLDDRFLDEAAFAAALGKHIIAIHLDRAALPRGLSMLLNSMQAVFFYEYADENAFYERLFASDALKNLLPTERQRQRKRKLIGRIVFTLLGVFLALVAVVGVALYRILSEFTKPEKAGAGTQAPAAATASPTPAPTATPAAVEIVSGVPLTERDVAGIESVSIYADHSISDAASVALDDGRMAASVDLTDLSLFTGLTYLSVKNVSRVDLTPVWGLSNIEVLVLKNVGVGELSGLHRLTRLIRLQLTNTDVTSLAPLADCDFSYAEKKNGGFHLTVESTKISDYAPLSKVKSFYALHLDAPYPSYAAAIEKCESIDTLTVSGEGISEETTVQRGVKSLILTDCRVHDLAWLAAFPNLENLTAENCGIAEIGTLPEMPALKTLSLSGNNLKSLDGLSAFTSLEALDVTNNKRLPDSEAVKYATGTRRVTYGERN